MAIAAAAMTDVGKRRPNNEDAYHIDDARGIFVVADGMGGHLAGEVASRIAVEVVRSTLEQRRNGISRRVLKEAVEAANLEIYRRSHQDRSLDHMGTTVVVAVVGNGHLLLAHVGDSRAYLLTEEGLQLLTDDHSLVFQWLKAGRISAEEARCHPQRAGLLQALGMDVEVEVDLQQVPYNGETLLLCSDGLTDMLRDEEIEEILRCQPDPAQACQALVQEANAAGGRDNITVVVARETAD